MGDSCVLSVSVIIVTHSRSLSMLSQTLDSVLNQKMPPCQIIIVDTSGLGSRHHEICDKFIGDNIQVYFTDISSNAAVGRNLGAKYATGDYICFLDDDDCWYPDKLLNQIDKVEQNTVLVYSPYIVKCDHCVKKHSVKVNFNNLGFTDILSYNYVGSTSFPLISRNFFNKAGGFDEDFEANQEWDLWIRLSELGEFKHSDIVVGIKNEMSDSITCNRSKRRSGWYSLFKKYMLQYVTMPRCGTIATGFFYREMWRSAYYFSSYFGFILHILLRCISRLH